MISAIAIGVINAVDMLRLTGFSKAEKPRMFIYLMSDLFHLKKSKFVVRDQSKKHNER